MFYAQSTSTVISGKQSTFNCQFKNINKQTKHHKLTPPPQPLPPPQKKKKNLLWVRVYFWNSTPIDTTQEMLLLPDTPPPQRHKNLHAPRPAPGWWAPRGVAGAGSARPPLSWRAPRRSHPAAWTCGPSAGTVERNSASQSVTSLRSNGGMGGGGGGGGGGGVGGWVGGTPKKIFF